MKSRILTLSIIYFLSSSLQAAVFGNYILLNGYSSSALNINGVYTDPSASGTYHSGMLCTDTHARLVPGEVYNVNGGRKSICTVEWDGRAYDNFEQYVLIGNSFIYNWSTISSAFRNEEKLYIEIHGITNGGIDKGNYVFHCRAEKNNGALFYGKYIPSKNGCYVNTGVDGTMFVGDWYNDYNLFVLTDSGL